MEKEIFFHQLKNVAPLPTHLLMICEFSSSVCQSLLKANKFIDNLRFLPSLPNYPNWIELFVGRPYSIRLIAIKQSHPVFPSTCIHGKCPGQSEIRTRVILIFRSVLPLRPFKSQFSGLDSNYLNFFSREKHFFRTPAR